MKVLKNDIAKSIALFMTICGATALLLSCEGRKTDNMVPTGDTVEVMIQPLVEQPDTIQIKQE